MAEENKVGQALEWINPLDPDAGLNLRKVPIVGNLFKEDGIFGKATVAFEDETVESNKKTTELTKVDYGKDAGKTGLAKYGTAISGAFLGGYISDKMTGGNKLWTGIGALAGAVILHKIGPELITDIQRGVQYVDQQKALGKSEGTLTDKFNAVFGNIKVKGQSFTPDTSLDANV